MKAVTYRCVPVTSAEEIRPHRVAWEQLEERALEDNVYLSAPFLLPQIRHRAQRSPSVVVFIYRDAPGRDQLVGVAAFITVGPTRHRPLTTLVPYAGAHGYCRFPPMLDRDHAREAIGALWNWIEQPGAQWSLVWLDEVKVPSPGWSLVEAELKRRRRPVALTARLKRPMLSHGPSFDTYLAELPRDRRKEYSRCWRRLGERGKVEVMLHRDLAEATDLAERFLRLENMGWKGESGSALACLPGDAAFFREMVEELGDRKRLFFVELLLDGRPIALTANFLAGESLFAFKVAYDPEFKAVSPGILAEVQGVRLFQEASTLKIADSGTNESSYIRDFWPDSVEMQSFYVATPRLRSRAYVRLYGLRSRLRRGARGQIAAP